VLSAVALAVLFVARQSAQADIQYPLCAGGCVLSYRGYGGLVGGAFTGDNTRQGVNPYEKVLQASTLVSSGFGKNPNSVQVDGQVYAQALFMSGVRSTWIRSENALFVATEHGSLYALEAFNLSTVSFRSILPSGDTTVPVGELPIDGSTKQGCANITYEVGITGTPVIDPSPPQVSEDPIIFAVVKSKTTGGYRQTIHAWDPVSNTEIGTFFDVGNALGWNSTNQLALMENQRAGLALSHDSSGNAIIYIAWGSHCDSSTPPAGGTYPYAGWVAAVKFTYNSSNNSGTFSLVGSNSDEPTSTGSAGQGGIWMAGAAPAIDDVSGDVYLVTGNGDFSTTASPQHFGQTFARLQQNTLSVSGSYTPNKWNVLNNGGVIPLPAPVSMNVKIPNDQDFASGGAILMKPAGQTINSKGFEPLAVGKSGIAYVLDPTLMGTGLSAADPDTIDPCTHTTGQEPLQCFQAITLALIPGTTNVIDGSGGRVPPSFWGGDAGKSINQNFLYTAGSQDVELRYWQMDPVLSKGTFDSSVYATGLPPNHGNGASFPYPGGGTLVTWNDTVSSPNANDAILWVLDSSTFASASQTGKPAILLAYPAFITVQGTQNQSALWSDSSAGPIPNKFTVPVVVNGQVYVAGQGVSSQCTVGAVGVNCGMVTRWTGPND
jgi:hypothetical protein